jgi:signal transduction histidine kinase
MRATGWSLSPNRYDVGWVVLSAGCVWAMVMFPSWETIPFHIIWISLTLLYGFRVWSLPVTSAALGAVCLATGASILADAFAGIQLWGELFEVPLMSAMFVAMVWHARRRVQAMDTVESLADDSARLLEQQERLLQNVSHELRTPVTIARGHLELLERKLGAGRAELAVAFDELKRIEQIVDRILLLARAERNDFLQLDSIQLVPFLEETFMRWVEVAPRAWRLGDIVDVTVTADETWLRASLDALLENAVQYTDDYARIELSARGEPDGVVISVEDGGQGIDLDALSQIFERFARSDSSRSRHEGGAGLGLAIVDAIARAHGGSISVHPAEVGSTFELRLPLTQAVNADTAEAAGSAAEKGDLLGAGAAADLDRERGEGVDALLVEAEH